MLIKSSTRVSRWCVPRHFPTPRNRPTSLRSRIGPGKTWFKLAHAKRAMHPRVFRHDPDFGYNLHVNAYPRDRDHGGSMGLHAPFWRTVLGPRGTVEDHVRADRLKFATLAGVKPVCYA